MIAGRVGDGDAGARGAEVERHHLHASASATRLLAGLERVAHAARVLAARLGERRLAAAAAADVLAELAHELRRVEAALRRATRRS